jgi:hypothetical protein
LIALLALLPSAAAQDAASPGWPKQFDARGSKIVVYEPQVESLRKQFLTSRAAVSVTREDSAEPVFGAIWLEAALSPDSDRGPAAPLFVRVSDLRLPNLSQAEAALLRQEIEDEIPGWKLSYSTLIVVAELKIAEQQKAAAEEIRADVPRILFRRAPAVLLSIDDDPAWRKSADPGFERLENTAAFVVRDTSLGMEYLHIPPFWWTSTDPLGPWQPADAVPDAVGTLWKNEPKPQIPPTEGPEAPPRPEVIAATTPTELVWTDGVPRYAPITGTDLLYIQNTDSDVFLDIQTQFTYALLSGRWYRTPQTKDAWEFVPSDRLPPDFSRIPLSSEKRHVLACVAGTPQAKAALRDAEIPQTEAVQRGPAPDLEATYDGQPQFTNVSDIGVQYAENTPYSIFCTGGRYYWCYDGIWYDSSYAWGPWFVCVGVPQVIYLIPPSCPHYYVTYCHVFGVSSTAVYCGYYPGYRGCYAWGGSVVYGTGWHYRPWVGTQCYTRPVTWGVGAHYSPKSSGWSVHLGSGGTSVWGLRRSPAGGGSQVQAGAGGAWGGTPARPIVGHRAPPPPSVNLDPQRNLYARQPNRLAPSPARPSYRTPPANPRQEPGRGVLLPQDRREGPPPGQELPRTPLPPSDHRENPRVSSPSERETPRAPLPREQHREDPKTPAPTEREVFRNPPSTEHEVPRTPPPREPRENPRTPPPFERETPRTPPPPRESPRTPPPPQNREVPRTPPPPPPQRDIPRTPPPPREHGEAPRNPPPSERREQQKDPPGSSDRRR